MNDMDFSVKEIKELMEAMRKNRIGSLNVGKGDFILKLEGGGDGQPAGAPVHTRAEPSPAADINQEEAISGNVVKAPIVGTFYSAPAPDKEPYVQVGSQVREGDVIFIIESMKLMNEVTSDYSGTVTQILAENAQGVEYGQPILVID